MFSSQSTLGVIDYVVFGIMLMFSSCIGLYYRFTGSKQKTTAEYLLANRSMGVIPVAFSLMASFMSAITLLGVSAEIYIHGTQFVVINLAYIFGTIICAYIFLPVFFKMRCTSAFEYLERRFNKTVRLIACAVFMLQLVLYMSIVLYAPALAFSAVTKFPKWSSVISVGIVCTFYSTVGGMKAVLWTDVFQSLLMFSAMIAVLWKGTSDVGSIQKVWSISEAGDRVNFFNFDPDPTVRHSFWSLVVGGMFTYVSIYGVNQAQVQRLLTIQDLKKSQMALFLSLPITSLLSILTSLTGLVMYANFYTCDPLSISEFTNVKSADQILPYFVMKSLGDIPGLPGLFVAGIFSGALSTMSSAVNSLATVTTEDFIRPMCCHKASDRRIVFLTKLIAFMYGTICILLTFVIEHLGNMLQASLTIFNVIGGPMLGLFTLGMLCPKAKPKGSFAGFAIALVISFWIGFGCLITGSKSKMPRLPMSTTDCDFIMSSSIYNLSDISSSALNHTDVFFHNETTLDKGDKNYTFTWSIYKLSYMWYAGLGFILTVAIGYPASLIEGGPPCDNPLLLSSLVVSQSFSHSVESCHMSTYRPRSPSDHDLST